MTRDITHRIRNTFGVDAHVYRVALNMDQVEEHSPPPNFAKLADSRCKKYVLERGRKVIKTIRTRWSEVIKVLQKPKK